MGKENRRCGGGGHGGHLSIAFCDFNCFYRRKAAARARLAAGGRVGTMRAPRGAANQNIFFFLFRFKVGFMKLVGLRALIFFLFRMFFLNITGFSLVCWGLKYFFWLLSCGLHNTGFVLLRFFFGLVLFTSECSVGTFPNVPLNLWNVLEKKYSWTF